MIISHAFIIKYLHKLGTEEKYLNLIKGSYKTSTVYIVLLKILNILCGKISHPAYFLYRVLSYLTKVWSLCFLSFNLFGQMTALINRVKQKRYHFTSKAKSYRHIGLVEWNQYFCSSEVTDKSDYPKTLGCQEVQDQKKGVLVNSSNRGLS